MIETVTDWPAARPAGWRVRPSVRKALKAIALQDDTTMEVIVDRILSAELYRRGALPEPSDNTQVPQDI